MFKTICRALVLAAAAACLAGCGTFKGQFDNRLTVTLSGDRAFVTSLYGPLGITAELSAEDAAAIAELREKARFAEQVMAAARAQAAAQQQRSNP